jgi:hypothetical protein
MNLATGSRKPDYWLGLRYNFHENLMELGKPTNFFNTTAYFPDMKTEKRTSGSQVTLQNKKQEASLRVP